MSVLCAIFALTTLLASAPAVRAAPNLLPGATVEFQVEVPDELRDLNRSPRRMPAVTAAAAVAVPVEFDPGREWPVLLVSGGFDGLPSPSRRLFEQYRQAALEAGWVIVAVDPIPHASRWDDTLNLRFALDLVVMDALHDAWQNAGKAEIAFAGHGGGSKFAGWLSAMFVSQRSRLIGTFQAATEEETLRNAAMQFQVLVDETYLNVPVFLYGGTRDEGPTAAHLRGVQETLSGAGYKNVVVADTNGADQPDTGALRGALRWFRELAARR